MNYKNEKGFTLMETLVVMMLAAIFMGFGAYNLREIDRAQKAGAQQLNGFFKQARAKAIGTTSSYRVYPVDDQNIATSWGVNCDSSGDNIDTQLTYALPTKATMTDTSWEVCFSARGIADQNVTVTIESDTGETESVEVFLGGAVRINES